MFDDISGDRRTMLKATGGLLGAAGIGGFATTALLDGSNAPSLRVVGRDESTKYRIVVDDPEATEGKRTEGDDDVQNLSDGRAFVGTVGHNEVDTYNFDGNVRKVTVESGHAGIHVNSPTGTDLVGGLEFRNSGLYYAVMTGRVQAADELESEDENRADIAQGTVRGDRDYYRADGALEQLELQPVDGHAVTLIHTYGEV